MTTRGAQWGWAVVRVVFGLVLALNHGLPKVTGGMEGFVRRGA